MLRLIFKTLQLLLWIIFWEFGIKLNFVINRGVSREGQVDFCSSVFVNKYVIFFLKKIPWIEKTEILETPLVINISRNIEVTWNLKIIVHIIIINTKLVVSNENFLFWIIFWFVFKRSFYRVSLPLNFVQTETSIYTQTRSNRLK